MRKVLIIASSLVALAACDNAALAAQKIGGECRLNGGTLVDSYGGTVLICYAPTGDAVDCYSKDSVGPCELLGIIRKDVGKLLQPSNPKGSSGSGGKGTPAHSGGTPVKGTTTSTTTSMPGPGPGPLHIVAPPPANNIQTQKNVRQN
jgi:hypothetical protein